VLADELPPNDANRLRLLENMIRIRVLEEASAQLYGQEKIRGFLHLYIGEEGVATGVCSALRDDDAVFATYREHGHALVRDLSARSIMAEMFGRRSGCSGGRGGSMHLFDASRHFYGGNAIVGGHLPLAAGMAYAQNWADDDRLTACFFGEGAVAEGEFHETLNLATLWNLPVLFCCENNQYAMGTSLESSESETNLALKASAYGLAAWDVDGMDVEAVRTASVRAVEMIRAGAGPVFIEFQTYRFRAHSMFDPDRYRPKEEVEWWRTRDPIELWARRLRENGELDDEGFDGLWAAARAEIDDAVAFATDAAIEPISELHRHVYRREAQ